MYQGLLKMFPFFEKNSRKNLAVYIRQDIYLNLEMKHHSSIFFNFIALLEEGANTPHISAQASRIPSKTLQRK